MRVRVQERSSERASSTLPVQRVACDGQSASLYVLHLTTTRRYLTCDMLYRTVPIRQYLLAVCLSKLVRERPSPPAESSRVPGAHHSLSFLSLFTLGFTFRRPFTLTITSTSPTSIALPSVIHCAQDVLVPGVQVSRSLWEAKDSPSGPRY